MATGLGWTRSRSSQTNQQGYARNERRYTKQLNIFMSNKDWDTKYKRNELIEMLKDFDCDEKILTIIRKLEHAIKYNIRKDNKVW